MVCYIRWLPAYIAIILTLITLYARRSHTDVHCGQTRLIRVIASERATTFSLHPQQTTSAYLHNAGDFVDLQVTASSLPIRSDKKIFILQPTTFSGHQLN